MEHSFDQMIERIVRDTGLNREEVLRRVNEKQRELDWFVTPEGAANIVARELGIVFERPEPETRSLRLQDLVPGMSRVEVIARVQRVQEVKEFRRSDGTTSSVGSIILYDGTGQARLTLWGEKTSVLQDIKKGDILKVTNGYVREGLDRKPEISLGSRGTLELNPDDPRCRDIPALPEGPTRISEVDPMMAEVDVIGRITGISEPKVFERSDGSTGKVSSIFITDGTGQIRVSLWGELSDISRRLKRGDVVRIENAYVKEGPGGRPELGLDSRGRIFQNPSDAPAIPELPTKPAKIREVEPNMPSVDVMGAVRRKLPTRDFRRSDGSTGKVASVVIGDETGTIRVSFWGRTTETAERINVGDVLLLKNASSRSGLWGFPELHVGPLTTIEINPSGVDIKTPAQSQVNISELEPNMEALKIVGRIIEISAPRDFTDSSGRSGKVMSMIIGDQSGAVRVSLWHRKAEEGSGLRVGDIVRLIDCYTAPGLFEPVEVHLEETGRIERVEDDAGIPRVEVIRGMRERAKRTPIAEIGGEGARVQIRGTVVQVFNRRPFFEVCPSCGRSLGVEEREVTCRECGKVVTPEHRPVLSLLLDDGTETLRVVMFGKIVEDFLKKSSGEIYRMYHSAQSTEEFYGGLNLISRELVVTGVVRQDRFTNQPELRAYEVREAVPVDETRMLIEELKAEAKKI
ncbi:MAG: DUF2240 family protein [Candidatus Hadarchaeales archaeon]